jgi:hypothetical protein
MEASGVDEGIFLPGLARVKGAAARKHMQHLVREAANPALPAPSSAPRFREKVTESRVALEWGLKHTFTAHEQHGMHSRVPCRRSGSRRRHVSSLTLLATFCA